MAEAAARPPALRRPVRYRAEAAAAWLLFGLFRALPLDLASALGAGLGQLLGRLLRGLSARAARQLRTAMPELAPADVRRTVTAMWAHLGRTAAEFAQLDRITFGESPQARVHVIGRAHLDALRDDGTGAILFTGHVGNWELCPVVVGWAGLHLHVVYRAANNPLVDRLIGRTRDARSGSMIAKGARGARQIFALLRRGEHVGMLIDQKLNDGIPVPFFGRPAMTAPALAQCALRYGVPVVPVRCERLGGARFRVTVLPPLDPPPADCADPVAELMGRINALIESWIRERPEQWLWMHRRWPED